jgi:hypothetical protein
VGFSPKSTFDLLCFRQNLEDYLCLGFNLSGVVSKLLVGCVVCRREVCSPWQHQMGVSIMHRRLTLNDLCGILLQMVKLPLLMGILGKKIHWQIV